MAMNKFEAQRGAGGIEIKGLIVIVIAPLFPVS